MPTIQTVRGSVDTAGLGRVLMHEHVFVLSPEIMTNYPEGWDEQERIDDAITRLRDLKAEGIDTIVDPTVLGLGRYIPRCSASTSRWTSTSSSRRASTPTTTSPCSFTSPVPGGVLDLPEPMVELFVRDIREGIADTGVKAGLLKCAIDEHGLTPGVERVLRAVGRAHMETGTPITVHTSAHLRTGLIARRSSRTRASTSAGS